MDRRREQEVVRVARRLSLAVAIAALLALGGGSTAVGQSTATIVSAGPLTSIGISDTLNCSVNHTGDTSGEFYADTACGTFIAVGGTVYGPAAIPAGGVGQTPFTPVSQSAVTGDGSSGNPFRIVTVVDAGSTGVRITETDSYVVGQEAYRTDVAVSMPGGLSAIVYRAGDCYLQNSDRGYGTTGPAGAVACRAVDSTGTAPGDRIEQWLPLTGGSSFIEDGFATVWSKIAAQQPFPNTCQCDQQIDNGGGLSWSIAGSATLSHLTTFSPTGVVPLTMAKTADLSTAVVGGADGYTITISNPNTSDAQMNSVVDDLPAGFAYTPGSSSGAGEPTVAGNELTWSGIKVPASGSASIHFGVTVSSTPGTYSNSATGDAGTFAVAGTGPTAPVTVVTPPADLQLTQIVNPPTALPGDKITYTLVLKNGGPSAAANVVVGASLGNGLAVLALATSQGNCSGSSTITCSLGTVPNGAIVTIKFVVQVLPSGSLTVTANAHSDQSDPNGANNSAAVAATLLPPPVPGKEVNAEPVRGKVLVDGKPLTKPDQVHVGATVDTTHGEVRLVTKNGDAHFYNGVFQIHQQSSKNAVTELALKGGNFTKSCKQGAFFGLAALEKSKKPVRQLWGHGKGKFRTRARYSSATVRGTYWLTADRCDGTLTKVKEGTVTVVDFARHTTVTVKAGESYLATPRSARTKHQTPHTHRRPRRRG